VAAALLAQQRQRGLRDPQRAEQVGLDLSTGLLLGDLLDRPEVAVAGVVDDDVQAAEMLVSLGDGGERRLPVGDIEREREQRVAVLDPQVLESARVAGGGRNAIAALQCRARPLPTETA
jgi:hypothetical protein